MSVSCAVLVGARYRVTDVQTFAVAFAFPTPLTETARSENSFNVTALFHERRDDGAATRICSLLSGSEPPNPTAAFVKVIAP